MKNFYLKTVMPTAPVSGKLTGNKCRATQARFLYYTTQQGGKYVIPKNTTLIVEKSTKTVLLGRRYANDSLHLREFSQACIPELMHAHTLPQAYDVPD